MGADFFQDNEGNNSSMRIVWAVAMLIIVLTWAYVSIVNKELQSLTVGDSMALGILFGGKVGQSVVERMKGNGGKTAGGLSGWRISMI